MWHERAICIHTQGAMHRQAQCASHAPNALRNLQERNIQYVRIFIIFDYSRVIQSTVVASLNSVPMRPVTV